MNPQLEHHPGPNHAALEAALRESEARRAAILESALDCIITMDAQGRVIDFNPAAERTLGYTREQALGRTVAELMIPERLQAAHRAGLARYLATGEHRVLGRRIEVPCRRADGSEFPAELAISAVRLPGSGVAFTAYLRDITEGKRAEAALRDSEERFRATFSQAAVGVTHVAPDGRWLMVNQRFCDIVGYPRDELLLQSVQDLTHPDDRARDDAERARLFSGAIDWYTIEKRYIRKGGEAIWVNATRSVVREADGAPRYAITFVEDISDRKRYEDQLRTSLAHAERITRELEFQRGELRRHAAALMESNADLEDFAYIASHDLKEPLRGISTSAEFLVEDFGERLDPEAHQRIDSIVRLSRRMYNLLDSLLEYSRVGRTELAFAPTDLGAVLSGVLESLQATLDGASVAVRGPLPTVRCDRVRVGQIFSNLIANSVKYNERADKRVEIGVVEGEPTTTLYVRDNGIGIRPEHHATIFKMFKRLHHRDRFGGGSGAGLTIVKRIVERHGGRVWLSSSPDQGTTFYFTLEPPDAPRNPQASAGEAP